jgi:hypothetical protein
LGWYDDTKQRPAADKIREAAARCAAKHGYTPNLVLVNAADAAVQVEGLTVQVGRNIRPNYYFVGLGPEGDSL